MLPTKTPCGRDMRGGLKQTQKQRKGEENNMAKKFIVGVTACQIGIAHTFMAAESLTKAIEARGCEAKIETQGATGAESVITDEDIARADAAIIAADVKIKQGERFEPIPTLSCKTNEVMTLETALGVVDEVLEAIE